MSAKMSSVSTSATTTTKEKEKKRRQKEKGFDIKECRNMFTKTLDDIDRIGDFCFGEEVTNNIPSSCPEIFIEGMKDSLQFPLSNSQATELRSVAEKAPFGKGLDTVLDETVRKAWQVDSTKVKFCGNSASDWQH